MIVVAMIGVLAALAIYSVRRYMQSAKTSEAKNGVGAIARAAEARYSREVVRSEDVPEGFEGTFAAHALCGSPAFGVPAVGPPAGKKYQPVTDAADYELDDSSRGWKCLAFKITEPQHYQYLYAKNAMPFMTASGVHPWCANDCYMAGARGDLDGDGEISEFASVGQINTTTNELKRTTQLSIFQEFE
jgi:type IV pilus assembly protein PilA